MFLKFRDIHSKTSDIEVPNLRKFQNFRPTYLLKSDSNAGVFAVNIAKRFKSSFFIEHLQRLILQTCSIKKAVLKILQTSLELIVVGVLFNQNAALELPTLSK